MCAIRKKQLLWPLGVGNSHSPEIPGHTTFSAITPPGHDSRPERGVEEAQLGSSDTTDIQRVGTQDHLIPKNNVHHVATSHLSQVNGNTTVRWTRLLKLIHTTPPRNNYIYILYVKLMHAKGYQGPLLHQLLTYTSPTPLVNLELQSTMLYLLQ